MYCNTCAKTVNNTIVAQTRKKQLDAIRAKKAEAKKEFKLGFVWGAVAFVVFAIITLATYFTTKDTSTLPAFIFLTVGSFTITTQIFWGNFIADIFFFFCRSFKWPFGFIFELSLDGIIWLLTVKLALWIICTALSIAFFILGLFVSSFLSIFSFPFAVIGKAKEI